MCYVFTVLTVFSFFLLGQKIVCYVFTVLTVFSFFLLGQKIVCDTHILLLCFMTEKCVLCFYCVNRFFYFVVGFDVCCSQGIFSFRVTLGR